MFAFAAGGDEDVGAFQGLLGAICCGDFDVVAIDDSTETTDVVDLVFLEQVLSA